MGSKIHARSPAGRVRCESPGYRIRIISPDPMAFSTNQGSRSKSHNRFVAPQKNDQCNVSPIQLLLIGIVLIDVDQNIEASRFGGLQQSSIL